MSNRDFTVTLSVDQTPAVAFAAINNVRGWWSGDIEGRTDRLGEEFKYRYKDIHRCELKITEFSPGKKVVWHVLSNDFNFTKERTEWTGTDIVFDIARKGDKTEIRFTHIGLVPDCECYGACSEGWGFYINGSLRDLIATGSGAPNTGAPKTEAERKLDRN